MAVKFLKMFRNYNKNEVASFNRDFETHLIHTKTAEAVMADSKDPGKDPEKGAVNKQQTVSTPKK